MSKESWDKLIIPIHDSDRMLHTVGLGWKHRGNTNAKGVAYEDFSIIVKGDFPGSII